MNSQRFSSCFSLTELQFIYITMNINSDTWFVFYDQRTIVPLILNPMHFQETVNFFTSQVHALYQPQEIQNIQSNPLPLENYTSDVVDFLLKSNLLLQRFYEVEHSMSNIREVKKFAELMTKIQKLQRIYAAKFWKGKLQTFLFNRLTTSLIRLYYILKIIMKHSSQIKIRYTSVNYIQSYLQNTNLIFLFFQQQTKDLLSSFSERISSPFQFILFKIYIETTRQREPNLLRSKEQQIKRISSQENLSAILYKILYDNQIFFLGKQDQKVIQFSV